MKNEDLKMAVKVLIVDDSRFFRSRLTDLLESDDKIKVIDSAENGKIGVEKAIELKPDVIIMDIEMPVMNGIDATRQIMKQSPCPILMFSSLTHEGAQATLDALAAGAADFLPKQFEELVGDETGKVATLLHDRVHVLAKTRSGTSDILAASPTSQPLATESSTSTVSKEPLDFAKNNPPRKATGKKYKMILIGTSTGGPSALQVVLEKLPKDFPYPILLVQHMPQAFTPAFASRLNDLCEISVYHAEHNQSVEPGCAYLAPGGAQMKLVKVGTTYKLEVKEANPDLVYNPSVDETFLSVADVIGGDILSVILTGMGADGCIGAKALKSKGATVWAQDEESCVVYGMPQAVASSGVSSHSITLEKVAECIMMETK
jgi:two-component system chemotaxis response regulator CheB